MIRAEYAVVFVALAGLALAACTSRAERAHNECVDYGFVKGTTEYANCRMIVQQNAANRSAALAQAGMVQSQNLLEMGSAKTIP
jgi:hypothetical protein